MTNYKVGTWYKIDDMPDEFRDGRRMFLTIPYEAYVCSNQGEVRYLWKQV